MTLRALVRLHPVVAAAMPALTSLSVESVFNYWQDGDVSTRSDGFYAFCDALEVASNGKHAPASGWGLKTALQAWGNLWNQSLYPASTYQH